MNIGTYSDGGKHDVRSLLYWISIKINITNSVIADMLAVPNDDSKVTDVANDRSVFIFGMKLLLANFMTEDEDTLYLHPLL